MDLVTGLTKTVELQSLGLLWTSFAPERRHQHNGGGCFNVCVMPCVATGHKPSKPGIPPVHEDDVIQLGRVALPGWR